jgi:hypothetical protein
MAQDLSIAAVDRTTFPTSSFAVTPRYQRSALKGPLKLPPLSQPQDEVPAIAFRVLDAVMSVTSSPCYLTNLLSVSLRLYHARPLSTFLRKPASQCRSRKCAAVALRKSRIALLT